jgi:hypothetical protein
MTCMHALKDRRGATLLFIPADLQAHTYCCCHVMRPRQLILAQLLLCIQCLQRNGVAKMPTTGMP